MTFPLIAVLLAVLTGSLLGRSANFLVRRLPPAPAVALLAVASLAVSLATGISLTAIAVAVIAGLTAVAADGHWSAALVRAQVPMPDWLGVLAALAVLVLLARAVRRTVVIAWALVRAEQLCRGLRTGGGPIVIVDDGSADAFTVAGLRGCVVISRRLLSELSADERQVLTAHELSHLNNRHHLYVHVADIAAAANPLLAGVPVAVRLGVERWADEDAATGIGSRVVTGRALARVALLRAALCRIGPPVAAGSVRSLERVPVLGVGSLQVAHRVQALLAPIPRSRPGRVTAALLSSIAVLLICSASLARIHAAVEAAFRLLQSAGR